jgi:hypothetical protein
VEDALDKVAVLPRSALLTSFCQNEGKTGRQNDDVWMRLKLEVLAEISHMRRTCLGFHPFRRPKLTGVNIASFLNFRGLDYKFLNFWS